MKRFRDIKNRCFHLAISKRELTYLALNVLCSSSKEKIEHYEFLIVNQLLQKVIVVKDSRDIHRSHHPKMHAIEYHSDSLDDETNECSFCEFI